MSWRTKFFIIKLVIIIASLIVAYGFIFPFCISSTSDELVILGAVFLIGFTISIAFVLIGTIKKFFTTKESADAKE